MGEWGRIGEKEAGLSMRERIGSAEVGSPSSEGVLSGGWEDGGGWSTCD